MTPHTPYDAEGERRPLLTACPNPYCDNGWVRCEGGVAKSAYRVICRVCSGTGKAEGERG